MNNDAIDFLKWCNTPVYKIPGNLSYKLRCVAQFPDYDTYAIIDENGRQKFENRFFTVEELYDYWLTNVKNS